MSDQPPAGDEGQFGWQPPPVSGPYGQPAQPPPDPTQPIPPVPPPPAGPPGWVPPPSAIPPAPAPAGPPGYPPAGGGYGGYGPPPAAPYGAAYGPPGAGGYGYGAGPIDHPQGTSVLVLGILSLVLSCVCFGWVLGIIAIVMGTNAIKEIDASPGRYRNRGTVQAGRIMGIISLALFALGVVFWVVSAIAGSSSGY